MVGPAEAVAFGPDDEFLLQPVATALPFFTVQCSGAPSFWHGPGTGAFWSSVSTPWSMVGLPQLRS